MNDDSNQVGDSDSNRIGNGDQCKTVPMTALTSDISCCGRSVIMEIMTSEKMPVAET